MYTLEFPINWTLYTSLAGVISILDSASICVGNPQSRYIEMAESRKGKFLGENGEEKACLETSYPLQHDGMVLSATVRTSGCDILVHGSKCSSCKKYSSTLRAAYSRLVRKVSTPSKFANNRYLNTPQKAGKMKGLSKKVSAVENNFRIQGKGFSIQLIQLASLLTEAFTKTFCQ